MTLPRRASLLAALSLVLAVAASLFALLGPTGRYEEQGAQAVREGASPKLHEPRVVETGSTTLLGEIRAGQEDQFVIVVLAVPIVVALLPLALARTRFDRVARIIAGFLLVAFVWITGFSIGLFYFPTALAMVAAAAVR